MSAPLCNKMPMPNEGNPDKGYYCVSCGQNWQPGDKVEIPHVAMNMRPLPFEKALPDREDQ